MEGSNSACHLSLPGFGIAADSDSNVDSYYVEGVLKKTAKRYCARNLAMKISLYILPNPQPYFQLIYSTLQPMLTSVKAY